MVLAGILQAQSTALLTGTVVDPSGAALSGAEIVCQSRETAISHRMATDSNGLFRFPDLPIGVYDVTANRSGFAAAVNRGVTLVTGHSVDLVLQRRTFLVLRLS